MQRVMIVEDDFKIAEFLKQGLRENGYKVDVVYRGTDALEFAAKISYDIILLDIMLPFISGRRVLRLLRERGDMTPVIYLTALDSIDEKVEGLELGADDFLVKPFSFAELLARMDAVLRRAGQATQPQDESIIVIGDLVIDTLNRTVMRDEIRIPLGTKEYELLCLLAKYRGTPLSTARIAERIWNLVDSDFNAIVLKISALRKKIDAPFKKKLIHTVKGLGYVLKP